MRSHPLWLRSGKFCLPCAARKGRRRGLAIEASRSLERVGREEQSAAFAARLVDGNRSGILQSMNGRLRESGQRLKLIDVQIGWVRFIHEGVSIASVVVKGPDSSDPRVAAGNDYTSQFSARARTPSVQSGGKHFGLKVAPGLVTSTPMWARAVEQRGEDCRGRVAELDRLERVPRQLKSLRSFQDKSGCGTSGLEYVRMRATNDSAIGIYSRSVNPRSGHVDPSCFRMARRSP